MFLWLIGRFALTVVFGGVSVYWVQRIGHRGAEAVGHDRGRKDSDGGELRAAAPGR